MSTASSERPAQQRPNQRYVPGLRARPWWDAREFPSIAALATQTRAIVEEVSALEREGFLQPRWVRDIAASARRGDAALIEGDEGGWELFRLAYRGLWFEDNCAKCPVTARACRGVEGHTGTIAFGVLLRGTRVRAHCGLSNAKLRVHLGLRVPERCGLRVGDHSETWREGECLVFDDSFEHEAWNDSASSRVILSVDVFHPDLSLVERERIERETMVPLERRRAFEDASRWVVRR